MLSPQPWKLNVIHGVPNSTAISMGSTGDFLDYSMTQSFFATLECELI